MCSFPAAGRFGSNSRRLLAIHLKPHKDNILSRTQASTETVSFAKSVNPHPYKTLHQWKSLNEFTKALSVLIFYNHEGVIALNKPYGVGTFKHIETSKTPGYSSRSLIPEVKYNLEDALTGLKNILGIKELFIVKCTEKYTSGACILATNEKVAAKAKKAIRSTTSLKIPYQLYWAITKGHPVPESLSERIGLKMITHDEKGKLAEIVYEVSKRDVKKKRVKPVRLEYSTLQFNVPFGVALCQIATTTNKAHFIRIYLTRRTACILGDVMYGNRLRQILGKTTVLNPQNCDRDTDPFPRLGRDVMESLSLPEGAGEDLIQLPVMLHLRSLTLPNWSGAGRHLVLTAPLPPHFSWTCHQLGLDPFPKETVPTLISPSH